MHCGVLRSLVTFQMRRSTVRYTDPVYSKDFATDVPTGWGVRKGKKEITEVFSSDFIKGYTFEHILYSTDQSSAWGGGGDWGGGAIQGTTLLKPIKSLIINFTVMCFHGGPAGWD